MIETYNTEDPNLEELLFEDLDVDNDYFESLIESVNFTNDDFKEYLDSTGESHLYWTRYSNDDNGKSLSFKGV